MSSKSNFLIVHRGRLAIQAQGLFHYGFALKEVAQLTRLDFEVGGSWEAIFLNFDGEKIKYVYVDSIPENVRQKHGLPDPDTFSKEDGILDLEEQKQIEVQEAKLHIESRYKRYLKNEQKAPGSQFLRFINKGFTELEASVLTKKYGILEACAEVSKTYGIEVTYYSLIKLKDDFADSASYGIVYEIPELRTFYRHMSQCKTGESGIDSVLIHTLTGRSSNRGQTCPLTTELIVQLFKHINGLNDSTVTTYANAIIIANKPSLNKGKTVSRQTVNNIRNGDRKSEIKAAIHGERFILEEYLPALHREETRYPLDAVEVDFTKVHGAIKDVQSDKSTKRFICRIRDRHSRASLGFASGKSESSRLFFTAFRNMLKTTNGYLPAEFILDRSPAFKKHRFKNIVRPFLENLRIKFTVAKRGQGKGGVESSFKDWFEIHMPLYVGSLGGNIATSKRHRPKREIQILLSKPEYMRSAEEWNCILKEMDRNYNNTPFSNNTESKIHHFIVGEKPHAQLLPKHLLAYISWKTTSCTLFRAEFEINHKKETYYYGWHADDIAKSDSMTKFVGARLEDVFDLYFNPEVMTSGVFIFEKDSCQLVEKFPFKRKLFGNYIDHQIEPKRKKELLEFLHGRHKMKANLLTRVKGLSPELQQILKKPLKDLVEEIRDKPNANIDIEHRLEKFLANIFDSGTKEIDPFGLQDSKKPMQKARTAFLKPEKLKNRRKGGR